MFQTLTPPPGDPILKVMTLYREDPRTAKVDLGLGVYKDAQGNTPVMRAVKAAERRLVETQETKTYTTLSGDPAFRAAMAGLVLGDSVPAARLAGSAATGGTAAVRLGLDLVAKAHPHATIWISQPTWPNHFALTKAAGLSFKTYRYYDAENGVVDRAGMWADLAGAQAGDVVLVHGCCHNPTGADLNAEDWAQLADFCAETGVLPFVDIAYQGFGDGLDADAAGVRMLAARVERMIVAASTSKNFGLYRERTGCCLVIAPEGERATVQGNLEVLNRQAISFPPDHGARVVTMILEDPALRADWEAELTEMRDRMNRLRRLLAEALRDASGSDRFGYLADQRGMFSLLGGDDAQIERLREEYGVYVVGGGRLNMAGLTEESIPMVARGIAAIL
ncbi:aromatic amino acid transaminase [Pararhodobacter aggregans]|uniref:Aromatic amino acid aminotransferase n=1 Tax=Pararhodobacter aggregans TaxID=404875 RepID=A0A2T7UTU9_9RHOB|nr:amino acid aminotransferase [Pararhodobacter aggregans]PTX02775.1 aromatic amino acid aminotransferase [Pararhodobacter aggregans]PVE48001.1 aromatic amino acid aminotransferase [Pararhodobacter aggregans]